VCVDENILLRDIERLIKRSLPKEVIAGFEPDMRVRPEPIQRTPNRGGPARPGQARPGGFAKPRGDAPRQSRPSGSFAGAGPKPAGTRGPAPRRGRPGSSALTGSGNR
jgi:ATP-dependent RNA helicase RhlE